MWITGSYKIFNLFSSQSFKFFKYWYVSFEGHVTKWIFLSEIFQKIFLNKLSLGRPEILKTNFVLKLKSINRLRGKDVIKWIIKYFGGFFFNILKSGKNPNIKKNKNDNLLENFPYFGKNFKKFLL